MKRVILGFLLIALISCTHNTKPTLLSAEEEYQRAYNYFKKGDYKKSIDLFKFFFNRHPGSQWVDDAQFYYSESYYQIHDYTTALQEFQFLINNFPSSKWSEKALLRKTQCLEEFSPRVQRDQELTKQCLEAYEEFIARYPYSKWIEEARKGRDRIQEKLNQKHLEIGEIYMKMGKNEAAKIYLKEVVKKSEKWKNRAYLLLGDISLSEGKDSLAAFYYGEVYGEFEKEAAKKLEEIQ
ncbi:MAG: outer membrane protein assembly factor BamD [candidate division WOR-3 bacterium]|nr:outer membrane protein assembly factor BamD [candidate division WOR-3 bacterium]